jgi:zinc protease
MNYHLTRDESYSLGSIIADKVGVTIAHITVDTHHTNTVMDQVVHHIYPDALTSGAGLYDREAFLNAVNLLGAGVSTNISDGKLIITLRSTAEVFPKLLKLAETMLSQPTFAESELARIRTNVTNDLQMKQEKSSTIAHEALRNSLYSKVDRRYTAEIKTITKELPEVKTARLKQYHEQVLSTPWTCTIAGTKENISDLAKLLAKLKKGKSVEVSVPRHQQLPVKHELLLKDIPSRTNIDFSIGTPVPITLHHPDYFPLVFALGVLALPGFAGRLMNTVRNKEGLTYSIYGYREGFSGTEQGYLRIFTFFSPDKVIQGLTSTFRELKKFYKSGITATEFETFQTIFTTKQTMLQDSLLQQVSELHMFNENGFSVEEIAEFKARMKTVTHAQVNAAIKKYFDPKSFTISGAGPISNVKKELEFFVKTMA